MRVLQLRNGPLVSTSAVELALDLEGRGVTLTAEDGILTASPGALLTEDDRRQIRAQKWHLLAIAAYRGSEGQLYD